MLAFWGVSLVHVFLIGEICSFIHGEYMIYLPEINMSYHKDPLGQTSAVNRGNNPKVGNVNFLDT